MHIQTQQEFEQKCNTIERKRHSQTKEFLVTMCSLLEEFDHILPPIHHRIKNTVINRELTDQIILRNLENPLYMECYISCQNIAVKEEKSSTKFILMQV